MNPVFLLMNGFEFDASEDDFANMVLAVATSKMDKAQVAVFLKTWSKAV